MQLLYSGLAGVGDVAFNIIQGDAAGRYDHALLFVGVAPLRAAYVDRCRSNEADFRYVRSSPGKPWRAWRRTARALRALKPDIIILHGGGPSLAPCYFRAKLAGVPLLLVEHQSLATKSKIDWIFTALGQVLADRIVCLTPTYAAELHRRLGPGFRSGKNAIIANGIDVDAYARQPRRLGDRRTIGMAARLSYDKRFDLLIDAIGQLKKASDGPEWRLTIAGDGENRSALEKRVLSRGLVDDVDFRGLLSPEDLQAWYKTLDLYVHASEGETMSMSLLQAMAAGLPIVASDVSGIHELLSVEPPIGRLVAGQSGAAFADAITKLAEDAPSAAQMGARAQRVCYDTFSRERMFEGYDSLIADMT